ncbi:MAG: YchE family NAAT transporter [Thiobacillus sp.]|jgi:multiple antibiotic resistance protein|nr:YchE family NAAT transporter [Thiobacillus sp.]
MLEYAQYLKIFIGLLAIVNPFGAIPLFISMTADEDARQRRRTIDLVAIGVTIILLVALFFGEHLLTFFGITIDSFRVGGGILVLLMAIAMLHAKTSLIKQTDTEAHESIEKESVAIVPLAMPLLAGPGAISTVILAAHKANSIVHYLIIALSIVLLSVVVWGVLRLSPWIESRIGSTGINIFTRIMGLILTAIAVEFIASGIKGLFPVLAGTPA